MADPMGAQSSLPPEALHAITAPRAPDAPRRCFVCLVDQDPSDPPDSWVDPCPCTLEAHQDCMLSWVVDCERNQRPLICPVCKSNIEIEGAWNPVVAFADAVQTRFTRVSPFVLFTGVSLGIQFSSQMYGAVALWMFAGRDALMEFMLGPNMVIDGRATRGLKFARVGNAAILMNIAPVLLISQLLPGFGNKIFVPTASLYGMYHVMHDDHFVSWPPSPQLAMAVFPYIRSIYYNLWREFVFPHELNLNRQILGLPPADTRGNNREQRRIVERNEGGLLGFLQNVLDALDPEGEENRGGDGENPQGEQEGDNAEGPNRIDVEFVLEADQGAEAALNDIPNGVDGVDDLPGLEAQPRLQPQPQQEAAAQPEQNQENRNNHEAPPAPPARRFELGTLLSNFSNMLVSSLILPGVSFAMGEALRLVLPKSWTTTPPRFAWGQRPGLLQQQWGRSLVGGCLYVVAKDVIRLYTKHRKVAAMSVRRVKNVDRPRRSGNNQQQ